MKTRCELCNINKTKLVIVTVLLIGLSQLFLGGLQSSSFNQHYTHLANSFLHGKLFFLSETYPDGVYDTSYFKGNLFWPLGIFPAILMMPFVGVFGVGFRQGFLSFFFVVLIIFLLKKIFYKLTENHHTALYLTTAYVFGTAFYMTALVSSAWFFAHVVATLCLVLAIYFLIVLPKPWLVGLFFGCAFLTRMSVGFGGLFFVFYYLYYENNSWGKVSSIAKFLLPGAVAVVLFLLYNYLRFGDILETGYRFQNLPENVSKNREYGMWSLRHFPANIYLFVFKSLEADVIEGSFVVKGLFPSKHGLSFIFTSPIFLYLTRVNLKSVLNRLALVGLIPIAVFVFGSFGLGTWQYGYRFALDFQLFIFLILCSFFREKKLSTNDVLLLVLSAAFNMWMIASYLTH